jgi:hypothetical protein
MSEKQAQKPQSLLSHGSNEGTVIHLVSFQAGTRIVLKSHFGYEISKIDIYDDQYLIAHTPETLLMGDLESCKLSEVPWSGSGSEKFFFDNPQVCVLSFACDSTVLVKDGPHPSPLLSLCPLSCLDMRSASPLGRLSRTRCASSTTPAS